MASGRRSRQRRRGAGRSSASPVAAERPGQAGAIDAVIDGDMAWLVPQQLPWHTAPAQAATVTAV